MNLSMLVKCLSYAIVGILVGTMLLIGIAAFVLFKLPESGKKKNFEQMSAHFNKYQHEFEALNAELLVICADRYVRIDDDWTEPEIINEIGINAEQLSALRERFVKLDVPGGVTCFNRSVSYTSYSYGLSISGTSRGYLYTEETVENVYRIDEGLPVNAFISAETVRTPSSGSYDIYLKLSNSWYAYEQYED